MTILGNTSRSSSPTQGQYITTNTLSISFMPPASPKPPIESQTFENDYSLSVKDTHSKQKLALEVELKKAYMFGMGLGQVRPDSSEEDLEKGFQAFIQENAKQQANSQNNKHLTAKPTPPIDSKHQLELEKAYMYGRGLGQVRPNSSEEDLEKGFQTFIQNMSHKKTDNS